VFLVIASISLFAWLISYQPTVLFSQNKSATSQQYFFSQNKSATSQQYFSLRINQHQPKRTGCMFDGSLPASIESQFAIGTRLGFASGRNLRSLR
jgi:hypothetical protein